MHNLYPTYFQKLIEGGIKMMLIMESTKISVTKTNHMKFCSQTFSF